MVPCAKESMTDYPDRRKETTEKQSEAHPLYEIMTQTTQPNNNFSIYLQYLKWLRPRIIY